MRIIGGQYRGKQLHPPVTLPVRPTTDFAKTGLFNILANHYRFEEISVLDLYAGTGSITYEFLSRGCSSITCVERNKACIEYIRQVLEQLRAPSTVKVHHADAIDWLKGTGKKSDIIFADPPFDDTPAEQLLEAINERKLLNDEGVFVLEHVTGKDYSTLPGFRQSRKYGNVSFTFFDASYI